MREKVKCLAPFHAITPVVQIAELDRIFITGSVMGNGITCLVVGSVHDDQWR